MTRLYRLAVRVLALLLLFAASAARADTPIALWKSFDGRVNFTGTQVSLRASSNTNAPCTIYAPSVNRSASLAIPYGATVLSAQLYWAGSGTSDYTVTFESRDITATRKYSSATTGNGYDYFGGAADVTAIVKAKGSGTYSFSGLTVANGNPWCASQGVLGGFSLLVVYSVSSEPERVLNIYEGFRYVQNNKVVVNASNFRWDRKSYAVKEKARIGHITWEGDPTLSQNGESLLFEGEEMTDTLNPAGNQFNSSSNINNSGNSYGIDFDAYDTTVTIWSQYDASVTTTYSSGQDLVLLNAEILVVPTMPVADLAIKLVRNGPLKVGTDVEYKVTVTNNGPYTEAGTITVTNTLPAGMYYTAGTIAGWTCSATSTSGSCTYKGGLAPGASAPVLTVYARVTSIGEKTNTVKVSGTAIDDVPDNNTASDTGTATNNDGTTTTPPSPSIYVFTDSICKSGIAVNAPGECKDYSAATVGGKATPIYLTATRDGLTASPSNSASTAVAMEFMLECINPVSGSVSASYAGAAIPLCAASGQVAKWSPVTTITFPKGVVSLAQSLVYADIGRIRLNLRTGSTQSKTEIFVSAPSRIAFRRVAYGSVDNPGVKSPAGLAFAPAGAVLTIETGALLNDGTSFAPNFGNESIPQAVVALRPAPTPGVTLAAPGVLDIVSRPAWGNGKNTIMATYSEVGAVDFVAGLANPSDPDNQDTSKLYNQYFGVGVLESTVTVGRFYPAYFKTEVNGPFDCPPNLPDEYACIEPQKGAALSKQPFDVTVTPYNELNEPVKNFSGAWFREVALSAASKAGGPLTTGLTGSSIKTTVAGTNEIAGKASYQLAVGYDNLSPGATNISEPTKVYLRATAADTSAAGNVTITSQRTGVVSDEDVVTVLNGRLKLPNALGSDLVRTGLAVRPEYFAGKYGWLVNAAYAEDRIVAAAEASYSTCKGSFLKAGVCDASLLGLWQSAAAPFNQTLQLKNGRGTLWMRAPGKGAGGAARSGWYGVIYNGAPWLPGTTGRVSFGSHRIPVIYVREMYF